MATPTPEAKKRGAVGDDLPRLVFSLQAVRFDKARREGPTRHSCRKFVPQYRKIALSDVTGDVTVYGNICEELRCPDSQYARLLSS